MKTPETPTNERERLEGLRAYEILDTDPESSFDALTRLAAMLLGVPISLVSLVDSDRQWFKSRHGLDVVETPRDVSFCGHVVASETLLVVPDTHDDARFADNPLVTGSPRIRFYAGMPLRAPDGLVVGTLCAIDSAPRVPSPTQLEMLSLLAGQVVDQLEARRQRRLLAAARAAAEENERRLAALFAAMAEGVVVQNRDGVITSYNPAAERILGLTGDQLSGRSSLDPSWNCVQEDGAPFPGELHPAMVALRTGLASSGVVMGVHKPAGELTWISINARPLGDDGRGVITTFHEITALMAARARADKLGRQERLVTIGTLAAGVGHEINNPLSFVMANVEYAMEELRAIGGGSPSGRIRDLLEVLEEARVGGDRIRKIVRGLRSFAREESTPGVVDLAATLDTSIHLAAHELRCKATVVRDLGPGHAVLADDSRLSQVLVNLLVNAAQAFPTSDTEMNRIVVRSRLEGDGRVSITVSDNGPGIPEAMLRRVFDPFFTTKPTGVGTGLGLSISQSLVVAMGGELAVDSTVGVGSSFRVTLPAAPVDNAADGPTSDLDADARGRVLIVDDDAMVLGALHRTLARDFEVVATTDPREAWARLERGERFSVIFCDLMMPHISGDALFERARAKDPSVARRFVFITGGATEETIQDFLARVPNERVDKPFDLQTLREIARRYVIDAKTAEVPPRPAP